jgi:hypothetical protein
MLPVPTQIFEDSQEKLSWQKKSRKALKSKEPLKTPSANHGTRFGKATTKLSCIPGL